MEWLNALGLHHCIRLVSSTAAAAPGDTGRYADGMAVGVGEAVPVVRLTHLHLHQLSPTCVGILVSQESSHGVPEVRVIFDRKKILTNKVG